MFSYIKSLYVSDVRAQCGRFKEILFLRLLQSSPRNVQTQICFPSSLAIRAILRVCNAISLSLSYSFRLYANKFAESVTRLSLSLSRARGMSASPARNKITSPDNTRHFILSVLSRRTDKASHKFFNTSDLKINRVPRRMQKCWVTTDSPSSSTILLLLLP